MLFTSTSNGSVRALKYPLPVPKQPTTIQEETPDTSPLSISQKDQQILQSTTSPIPPSTPNPINVNNRTSASSRQTQVITSRQEIEHQDYPSHSYGISKLRSSHDDMYLFSAGHDGCIIEWKVVDRTHLPPLMKIKELKETLAKQRENISNSFTYADEIMVTQSDLKEIAKTTAALKQQVEVSIQRKDV